MRRQELGNTCSPMGSNSWLCQDCDWTATGKAWQGECRPCKEQSRIGSLLPSVCCPEIAHGQRMHGCKGIDWVMKWNDKECSYRYLIMLPFGKCTGGHPFSGCKDTNQPGASIEGLSSKGQKGQRPAARFRNSPPAWHCRTSDNEASKQEPASTSPAHNSLQ